MANQVRIIHAVEMVAAQNDNLVRVIIHGVIQSGAHRIAGALEPGVAVGSLLGGENVHETVSESIESVSLHDVTVHARRKKLGQNKNLFQARIDAVADGNIDETVLAGKTDGRFAALKSEGEEPCASSSPKDDGSHVFHFWLLVLDLAKIPTDRFQL